MVQLADKQDVMNKGGFIELESVKNNDSIKVYIENETLKAMNSYESLSIDGRETNIFGRKVARLTLIKN